LSVIISGIHEGRAVFANTSKYIMTTLSANFGNFFAVAIVSLIIDYLPMLPLQILLVNLLSDFPMIAVATDTVDSSEVNHPRKYDLKSFAILSLILGLTSTFFDFIFFATFKESGAPTLQTTWFIGSILTELVFIYSARTRKLFFKSKRPSWALMILTIIAIEITIYIPYTQIGHEVFKFVTPTNIQIMSVLGIVVLYFITTESVKLLYYRFASPKTEVTPLVKLLK
jgi:P-type Mg2+ transporter